MRPDDPTIHKYAGQILFENGAFEDALTAFSHQPLPVIPENYDVLLTQAKSYFLLARFDEARATMEQACQLKPTDHVRFDIQVIQLLHRLLNEV